MPNQRWLPPEIQMRNHYQNLFAVLAMAVFCEFLAPRAGAQVYTNFYGFSYAYESSGSSIGTNSDGANPVGGLCLLGNTLYGTANNGGISGSGTVFKVQLDGSGFTNLHNFSGLDGANPQARLVLSGHTLYGSTYAGGSGSNGTVFAVNTDGTGFTNLYIFSSGSGTLNLKNNDGAEPEAGLVLISNTLYGTTERGGASGSGSVFALHPDGTDFTNLHSFSGTASVATNSDGADPQAGLTVAGNTLYGTTASGGAWGHGAVFALNLDGTNPHLLYSFTGTNGDGVGPSAGLALSGNTLYGSTGGGGSSSDGILFAINTDGTGFTNLYSFTIDNNYPPGPNLILAGNYLYGTASGILRESFGTSPAEGFVGSPGSVFSFALPVPPPQLAITRSGTNVILTWPTNFAGFILQSAPSPTPAAAWTPVVPGPVVLNQWNSVTNPLTGSQQYYRLIQPAP